jgi:tetratricopeptide (TPR) repeat protein
MDNIEYIESYFTSAQDPDRTREFNQRIESNKEFAEEVAFYLAALDVSRETSQLEKKRNFKEIYQKNTTAGNFTRMTRQVNSPGHTPVRRLIYYIAAAAVVSGIVFGVYTMNSQVTPQQLASQYEQEYLKTLPVTMSGQINSQQTGLSLYNEGKTADALQQFEKIIQSDTSNFTAKENAGIAALRLKNYDKALYYFKQLETYKDNFSNPALFYQALTLMDRNQSGDDARAKQLLQQVVQNDLEEKETAQKWLKKW